MKKISEELSAALNIYKDMLVEIQCIYATSIYTLRNRVKGKDGFVRFGLDKKEALFTDVTVTKCETFANSKEYLEKLRNNLQISVLSIHEEFCKKILKIHDDYAPNYGLKELNKKETEKFFTGPLNLRWFEIQKSFGINKELSQLPREYILLDLYREIRNLLCHENGIISEKFIDHVSKISYKRAEKLVLGERYIISEYDFSEGIHLFILTSRRVITSIISKIEDNF